MNEIPDFDEFWELCKLDEDETHSWEYRFHKLALALYNQAEFESYDNAVKDFPDVKYNEGKNTIESIFKEYLKEAEDQLKSE